MLVPNPFYRTAKAPVFSDVSSFDFQNEADRAKLPPLMGPLTAAGAAGPASSVKSVSGTAPGRGYTNSMRAIGALSPWRGPSLRMRVYPPERSA